MRALLVAFAVLICTAVLAAADLASVPCAQAPWFKDANASFYGLNATDLSGTVHTFSEYTGKVVLVVNVASF